MKAHFPAVISVFALVCIILDRTRLKLFLVSWLEIWWTSKKCHNEKLNAVFEQPNPLIHLAISQLYGVRSLWSFSWGDASKKCCCYIHEVNGKSEQSHCLQRRRTEFPMIAELIKQRFSSGVVTGNQRGLLYLFRSIFTLVFWTYPHADCYPIIQWKLFFWSELGGKWPSHMPGIRGFFSLL